MGLVAGPTSNCFLAISPAKISSVWERYVNPKPTLHTKCMELGGLQAQVRSCCIITTGLSQIFRLCLDQPTLLFSGCWAIDVQQRIKCHGAPAPFFLLIAGSPWVMLLLHANLLSEDRDTFGTLRSIQNDRSQCSAPPRPAVIRHPNNLSTSLVLVSSICGRDACHHPCNPLPSLTFTCRLSLIASLCFTRTPSCLPVVSYVICVSIL